MKLLHYFTFYFQGPVIGVSKHLCGAATDFALTCLQNFAKSKTEAQIEIVLIALCCHHRCDYSNYVGKSFLLKHDFKPEEFSLLCGLTSWATCGSGRPRTESKEPSEDITDEKDVETNPHVDRYDRLGLPREKREEIGRRVKRILDFGRCQFVQDQLGLNTRLAYYVDTEYTLENVVMLASTKK